MSDRYRTSVLLAGCLGGLLLGGFIGSGCTPGSPSSSPSPDTEASAASPSAPAEMSSSDASRGSPDALDRTEGSRTVAQRLEDAGVAARVKQALVRTQSLRPFNFASAVVRGHLTLRGNVETREQYRTAERVASSVEGVTDITNQVTVQGRPSPRRATLQRLVTTPFAEATRSGRFPASMTCLCGRSGRSTTCRNRSSPASGFVCGRGGERVER